MRILFSVFIFLILLFSCAEANKQFDILLQENLDPLVSALQKDHTAFENRPEFYIQGTYNVNSVNKRISSAVTKNIKKLLKKHGYKYKQKEYLIAIPNYNDCLDNFHEMYELYIKTGDFPRYLIVPVLTYSEYNLNIELHTYDGLNDEINTIGDIDIKLSDIYEIDFKSTARNTRTGYFEIPSDRFTFSLKGKEDPTGYSNENTRHFMLPANQYKIKARNYCGRSSELKLILNPDDSLRIDFIPIVNTSKIKTIRYCSYLIPGTSALLIHDSKANTTKKICGYFLVLAGALNFYVSLSEICDEDNKPGNRTFLSKKAKSKFENRYYRNVALTCVLYIANVGIGHLTEKWFYNDQIKFEPQITNLKKLDDKAINLENIHYGLNLNISIGK